MFTTKNVTKTKISKKINFTRTFNPSHVVNLGKFTSSFENMKKEVKS